MIPLLFPRIAVPATRMLHMEDMARPATGATQIGRGALGAPLHVTGESMKRLLVLGVGNLLLTDDGVGIHAVQDLAKEDEWSGLPVTFLDGATFTQDIFHIFQEYERVLVLDAIKAGRAPGTAYRFTEAELRDNKAQRLSLHDIDLLDSL